MFRASFATFHPYFWLAGLTTTIGQLGFFTAIMFASVAHVSVTAASDTLLTIFLVAVHIGRAENISRQIMVAAFLWLRRFSCSLGQPLLRSPKQDARLTVM